MTMEEAVRRQMAHAQRAGLVDRRGWTRDQWVDDAKRLMADSDGAVTSLVNGHVIALLERVEELEASLVDRLRADGWEECALGVTDNDAGEWVHRDDCPYGCVDGVVPPDWMVEAAAKAMLEVDVMPVESRWWLWAARAALVEAARAVKEKE